MSLIQKPTPIVPARADSRGEMVLQCYLISHLPIDVVVARSDEAARRGELEWHVWLADYVMGVLLKSRTTLHVAVPFTVHGEGRADVNVNFVSHVGRVLRVEQDRERAERGEVAWHVYFADETTAAGLVIPSRAASADDDAKVGN